MATCYRDERSTKENRIARKKEGNFIVGNLNAKAIVKTFSGSTVEFRLEKGFMADNTPSRGYEVNLHVECNEAGECTVATALLPDGSRISIRTIVEARNIFHEYRDNPNEESRVARIQSQLDTCTSECISGTTRYELLMLMQSKFFEEHIAAVKDAQSETSNNKIPQNPVLNIVNKVASILG